MNSNKGMALFLMIMSVFLMIMSVMLYVMGAIVKDYFLMASGAMLLGLASFYNADYQIQKLKEYVDANDKNTLLILSDMGEELEKLMKQKEKSKQ
jgi:hypothetical protein